MHVLKMVKSMDDIFTYVGKNYSDIIPTVFGSLIFGFDVSEYNKYADKDYNQYSMSYKLNSNNKVITVFLGKKIVEMVKKNNIELKVVYIENFSSDLSYKQEPSIKTSIDGMIELKKDETMFDVFDRTFLIFASDDDYYNFMKIINI